MPIPFIHEIPPTLEAAVEEIVSNMTYDEKLFALANDGQLHHGVGTAIRNNWGLWTGSSLKSHMMERFGLSHADDLSGLILMCVILTLKGEVDKIPKALKGSVDRYKEHWERLGLNPLTLDKAKPDDVIIEAPP